MEKRIVLELRGEKRAECTSLDLSECKTGGEWEVNDALGLVLVVLDDSV